MSFQLAFNPCVQRPAPLTVCPTRPESISFPTYWYRLPDEDNFLICTKCFEDKLSSTRFASLLRCDYLDFGPEIVATCDFSTPRIDSLLRQAIASNDFEPLRSFAKKRMKIKNCQGVQGIKGGNDVNWFKPVNDDIPGFISCEACYEDVVLGTNFGPQVVPYPEPQPADAVWFCDLAIPYLKHSIQGYAWSADWSGFVQAARHRMSLPTCARDVPAFASGKRWYNTVRPWPIHNMTICEACYLDRVGWQRNTAQHFAPIAFSPYQLMDQMTCDFNLAPMAACSNILLPYGMCLRNGIISQAQSRRSQHAVKRASSMANGTAYPIRRIRLGPLRILTSVPPVTQPGTKVHTWLTCSAACITLRRRHGCATSTLQVPDTRNTSRNGTKCG